MSFKYIRHFLTITLLFITAFSMNVTAAEKISLTLNYDGKAHKYTNDAITLSVNGNILTGLDIPPVIINDRTYVPVKYVFEALGAVVDYKSESQQVFIGYKESLIVLKINSTELNIDGNILKMEVAPKIINDRTMIPVKFAAEALNFTVDWHKDTKTVIILDGAATNNDGAGNPVISEAPSPLVTPPPTQTAAPAVTPPPTTIPSEEYTGISTGTAAGEITTELAIDISTTKIAAESNPETQVTELTLPAAGQTYAITAAAKISKVEKQLLPDNRLIIDIYNTRMALPKTSYEINGSFLKSIRAGQNIINNQNVTRVVFDLTRPVSYSVSISSDRKSVYIAFEKNTITNVAYQNDSITITGITVPVTSLFPLTNPNRLVIDIPLSTMNAAVTIPANGTFASTIRTAQFDENTARVVVDLNKNANYQVSSSGNSTTIKLVEPTYKNIQYDSITKTLTLTKPVAMAFSANQITQTDQYLNLRYTLTLPGNYSADYGAGDYIIKDGLLNSVNISQVNGNTVFMLNENKILAYNITEDATNIYIKAISPKEKYSKIVYIDAGHGANDPGGVVGTIQEKDLNLQIALKLINLLEADGRFKVYASRLSDTYPTNPERAAQANEIADIFISIHNNKGNAVASGTEVLYAEHASDAALGFNSMQMAQIFQDNLINTIGSKDRKIKLRPNLIVLNSTSIPAVLCEVGFIDVPEEAQKLITPEYQQLAANALMKSISDVFETYTPKR